MLKQNNREYIGQFYTFACACEKKTNLFKLSLETLLSDAS